MADEENHDMAGILARIDEPRAGIRAMADEENRNGAEIEQARAGISFNIAEIDQSINELREALRGTPLEIMVKRKSCAGVHNFLKAHKEEVNSHLDLGRQYASLLTGLEWALWNEDWKMCALFFIHGADPDNNAFNGVVRTTGSLTVDEQEIFDGFNAADPRPIKGFAGPKALPNNGSVIGDAYLYIMERIHCGAIDLKADYGKLAGCVDVLANDLDFSSADLESLVIPSLAAFRSVGLCRDTSLAIVERAVMDTSVELVCPRLGVHMLGTWFWVKDCR